MHVCIINEHLNAIWVLEKGGGGIAMMENRRVSPPCPVPLPSFNLFSPLFSPTPHSTANFLPPPLFCGCPPLLSFSIGRLVHAGVGVDDLDLAGGGGPVGAHGDGELAEANAEELEQTGLAGVEDVAGAADLVGGGAGAAVLLAEHDLAAHHARGHAEAAQLGLERVAERHVVGGRHLAARRHDGALGDREGPRRRRARPRKVGRRHRRQLRQHPRRLPVRQQQARRPVQVPRQLMQALGRAVLGRPPQRPRHERRLAEEDSGEEGAQGGLLSVAGAFIVQGQRGDREKEERARAPEARREDTERDREILCV